MKSNNKIDEIDEPILIDADLAAQLTESVRQGIMTAPLYAEGFSTPHGYYVSEEAMALYLFALRVIDAKGSIEAAAGTTEEIGAGEFEVPLDAYLDQIR